MRNNSSPLTCGVPGAVYYAWRRSEMLWMVLAFAALALAVLQYAVARPTVVIFLPVNWHRPIAMFGSPLATVVLGSLPTYLHTVAMCLLSAAVLRLQTRREWRTVCWIVAVGECAFEVVQARAVGSVFINQLPAGATLEVLAKPLESYFRFSTFDGFDLLAALTGCATAALIFRQASFSLASGSLSIGEGDDTRG